MIFELDGHFFVLFEIYDKSAEFQMVMGLNGF